MSAWSSVKVLSFVAVCALSVSSVSAQVTICQNFIVFSRLLFWPNILRDFMSPMQKLRV